MWEGVPQCGRVSHCGGCSSVWRVAPVREGVAACVLVYPSVGGCNQVWEGVSNFKEGGLSVERCFPVWEGVS